MNFKLCSKESIVDKFVLESGVLKLLKQPFIPETEAVIQQTDWLCSLLPHSEELRWHAEHIDFPKKRTLD